MRRSRYNQFFVFVFAVCVALLVAPASKAQLVINTVSDLAFGTIEFDTTHNGSLRIGTNSAVQVTGSGMVSQNDAQAGHLVVADPSAGIIEIKCNTTGKMTGAGNSSSLDIINTEVAVDVGVAHGSGLACGGTKKNNPVVTTVDLAANPDPDIYLGAQVDIAGPLSFPNDYLFTTTSGGGKAVTISIVIQ